MRREWSSIAAVSATPASSSEIKACTRFCVILEIKANAYFIALKAWTWETLESFRSLFTGLLFIKSQNERFCYGIRDLKKKNEKNLHLIKFDLYIVHTSSEL